MHTAKILIKYPTRGRPLWFFKTLDLYIRRLSKMHDVTFLVSMDTDDESMDTFIVRDYLEQVSHTDGSPYTVKWYYEEHNGKVSAINSKINDYEFDILFVVSEDIIPTELGYDDIIVNDFLRLYPDLDGLIHYNDGRCGRRRIPIPIMGRKFYDRFGWIVHPDFIAWGDDYTTKMWRETGKVSYIERLLLLHENRKYLPLDRYSRPRDATAMRAKNNKLVDARTRAMLIEQLDNLESNQ